MKTSEDLFLLDTMKLATKAHAGQTRWDGSPYIVHPVRVAFLVYYDLPSELLAGAALLHDVVEDTDLTLDDIPSRFHSLVDALTKRDGETKLESVERLAENGYALLLKMADRLDNILDAEKNEASAHGYKDWDSVKKSSLRLLELVKSSGLAILTESVVYDRLCMIHNVGR